MVKKTTSNSEILRHISVDVVVFGYGDGKLKVLLRRESIERDGVISTEWKLPGNHVRMDETIEETAIRVLYEQTGVRNIYLRQFHVFSALDRLRRREFDYQWIRKKGVGEERVVTVGFYAAINLGSLDLASMSPEAEWKETSKVGALIFDHREIFDTALEKLRDGLSLEPAVFELLADKFTLTEMQQLYETILGYELDKRNFRRKAIAKPYIVPLAEREKGVAHRAAVYYMCNRKVFDKLLDENKVL